MQRKTLRILSMPHKKALRSLGLSYKILSLLKESEGFSVYKALRENPSGELGQEVLLKIFSENKIRQKEELSSLLQVRSPYCARLLSFESFGRKKGFVLEFIKGCSFLELLENFSLSPEEIENLMTQTYQGLEDLRAGGLCHGDLSLKNLLLDQKGQVKLIDFGKGNYQTEVLGTPPFVAPEVLQGMKPHFQSDLFSLGVLEIFLRQGESLYTLKERPSSFFIKKEGLTHLDPQKRKFLKKEKNLKPLPSLAGKVQILLRRKEGREWDTEKLELPSSPSSLGKKGAETLIRLLLFGLLGFFATASSEKKTSSVAWLSVRTNAWFFIQIKDFKSYSPFEIMLPADSYEVLWESRKARGRQTISLEGGDFLILNDKDFLKK